MTRLYKFARALACGVFLLAVPLAHAFTEVDAGVFAVLDQKGEPTDRAYRFFTQAGKWVAEERKPDASWAPIECKSDCDLRPSTAAELQKIFRDDLAKLDAPACLQNSAFTVCRYTVRASPPKIPEPFLSYILIVQSPKGPVVYRLDRIAIL